MAEVQSNINLNINTSGALANLKMLQSEISRFQQTMSKAGAVSNAQLANMRQNLVNSINATGQFSASIKTVATTTESFTNALEKNKLSMGQYFKYAGASTKSFGKLFRNEFDTIDKVARERVKTLQTQYIKLGRDANGAMQAIAIRPQVLDMNDLGTKTAIASQKVQLFNQLMKQGSTNLLNFGKNTQWAGRQLMVGFTIPLGIMGAAAAREFTKIEEQVIRLQRVYGDFTTTMGETEQITEQVKSLATEFTKYGVAVEKTIGLAADAAAMGKTGADLIAQVNEANRLAVLGGVSQQQSLETTISLTNAFGVSADKLAGKINFLNAVENQTVTSIEDLTEAIPKAGPVVQQLGGDVEDLTFFLTAMREGGINASEGANALKSGLASIINPTQEATDKLNSFGINLQGIVDKDKGNVKQMVIDLGTALNDLDPLNRAQAIEQLFGKFQFARMSTLFQNVVKEGSQATRVLDLTTASAEELAALSQRELTKLSASPLYQFQGAIERFKASLAPVGEEFMKAVTPLINFGTDVLKNFDQLDGGVKQFIIGLTGIVAGIGPILLMTFGLIANGVANLVKGFLFVKNIFSGAGQQSNILTEQLNYMTNEQLQAAAVATSLGQVHSNLIQTFTSEAGAVNNLAAAYQKAVAAQGAFTGPTIGRTKGGSKTKKMASGGILRGPGNGTSDSIPAMLSNGEAIIPAKNVKKYPGMVDGLIAGNIPGFARGKGSGSAGRIGKSGITVSRPYLENVSNTGGILGFTDINATNMADLSNIYTKQIAERSGVSIAAINKEIINWEKANSTAIKAATAAVEKGADPAKAYEKLITKFNSDMQKADGPVSKFSQTATAMMPELSKDLKEAQAYARKMKLDVKNAADATKLAKALPKNQVAQGMVTPGNYQSQARTRQAAAAIFGGTNVAQYGIPRFMITPGTSAKSKAYKAASSQEHFSETPQHAANLERLRNQQLDSEKKITTSKAKKAKTEELAAKQAEVQRKSQARSDAARRGWETRRAKIEQQQVKKPKFSQRLRGMATPGRLGGVGMIASTALMGASMAGGPVGDIAGQISGPVMALSSLASVIGMLPGPVGLAVGAIGAVGVGLYMLDQRAKQLNESAMNASKALSSGKQAMDLFSQATGNISPTDILNKRRLESRMSRKLDTGAQTFGGTYLQSEEGSAYVNSIRDAIAKVGSAEAGRRIAAQLATSVSSGIMTPEQAKSIADNLAVQLNNSQFGINVTAKMTELIGTNGEDISKEPLAVSVKLIEESGKGLEKTLSKTDWGIAPLWADEARAQNEADIAQGMRDVADQEKLALDTLQLRHEARVQELKDAGDLAKIAEENAKYEKDRETILKAGSEIMKKQVELLNKQSTSYNVDAEGLLKQFTTDQVGAAIIDKMEAGLKKGFETLPEEAKNIANATAEGIANTELLQAGQKAQLLATVTIDNVDQFTELKKYFPLETTDVAAGQAAQKIWNFIANVSTNLGTGAGEQMTQILNMFEGDQAKTQKFIANIDVSTTGGQDQINALLKAQEVLGSNFTIDMFVNDNGAMKDLTDLQNKYDEIQSLVGNEPITMETVINADPEAFGVLAGQAEWFNGLPAVQQKFFLENFVTVRATIDDSEVQSYLANKGGLVGVNPSKIGVTEADRANYSVYRAKQFLTAAQSQGLFNTPTGPGNTNTNGGGGGGGAQEQVPTELERYQAAVSIIGNMEDSVNKKYEKRLKALDEIQKAQEAITQEQRDQLDLADALTKGDMASAARAMQQMRANEAQRAIERQKEALDRAKQKELDSLTYGGHTKAYWEAGIKRVQNEENARVFAGEARASGGIVNGPGTETSDSIRTWLSNGEYVLRAKAVKSIGVGLLNKINTTGQIPSNLTMPKYSVNGSSNLKSQQLAKEISQANAINNTKGDSMYNYSIAVNANTDANPQDIARVVMNQIRNINSQQTRGNFING